MNDSRACPERRRLADLLAGSLAPALQDSIAGHVEGCPKCQAALEELAVNSWGERARQLGEKPLPDELVLKEVMHRALSRTTVAAARPADEDVSFLDPPHEAGHLGRLGHYEVLELLGKGGFGLVFKAHDEKLDRIVAIKVMAPALAANGTARKRFIREAKAAAAVRNEHVIDIHAIDETVPYLVMEFVAGQSLQEKLDQSGPLELKEILRIGMQTAQGLAAAHAQGLVHRDVKPGNILLENGVERVKITDFGLARAVDDASVTQSGMIAGTPQYMAPEQAAGENIDHRADLFSLGSVLYAMCTGRSPFRGSGALAVMKRVCEETPRPIEEINPDVPDWLCILVEKLHAKEPGERFQSAKEVADLLGRHLAHLQQPSRVTRPVARRVATVERPAPPPTPPMPTPAPMPTLPAAAEAPRPQQGPGCLALGVLLLSSLGVIFLGILLLVLGFEGTNHTPSNIHNAYLGGAAVALSAAVLLWVLPYFVPGVAGTLSARGPRVLALGLVLVAIGVGAFGLNSIGNYATLHITTDDWNATIVVQGPNFKRSMQSTTSYQLDLFPGKYVVRASLSEGSRPFFTEEFTLERGGMKAIHVPLAPPVRPMKKADP